MNDRLKALFDVSILIAALHGDGEGTHEAHAALSLSADGVIDGYVCAGALEALNDLLTRTHGVSGARTKLQELRSFLDVAPVDRAVFDAAISLDWAYLDDALAHECARLNDIDLLITLNPTDFLGATVEVHGPSELLRTFGASAA